MSTAIYLIILIVVVIIIIAFLIFRNLNNTTASLAIGATPLKISAGSAGILTSSSFFSIPLNRFLGFAAFTPDANLPNQYFNLTQQGGTADRITIKDSASNLFLVFPPNGFLGTFSTGDVTAATVFQITRINDLNSYQFRLASGSGSVGNMLAVSAVPIPAPGAPGGNFVPLVLAPRATTFTLSST